MPKQIIYCIDTSALIDLKRLYPSDVFPTLWEKLGKLIKQGRLIAPREVLKEIEKKDDELLRWVKKHKSMFKDLNQEQVEVVKEIQQKFPALVDHAKEIPEADPFVIALAIVESKKIRESLFEGQCMVVTQEKPSRGGKPRIPDVCQHYGIDWMPVGELFKKEQWRF